MLLFAILAFGNVATPSPTAAVVPPVMTKFPSCLPTSVTRGARVVALSAYQSSEGRTMPFMLAGSNNNAVHVLTVTGKGRAPIVLVVTSYEPILWDLSAVSDRVRAVVASGYYPQAVRGVAPEIPVRFSSSVGRFNGSDTCAHIDYAYDDVAGIQKLANDTKRAIGVYPDVFYGSYSISRLDVDGPGAAAPGAQDFSDIRTSVPLITADDPASGAQMKYLPSPDETNGPRLRIVEWNDAGKVVRDEGGRKPAASASAASSTFSSVPAGAYERKGSDGMSMIRWLMWLGLGAFAFWQWYRARRSSAARRIGNASVQPTPGLSTASDVAAAITAAPSAFQKQLTELSALAAITDCEPLVVALHRYGREVQNLPRIRFEPDLADEINAIVVHHFDHAIDRYRQVRTSLDGEEGTRADAMLTRAIERLTLRLQELQAEQHHRDVDGVDEAARFIDARHPV